MLSDEHCLGRGCGAKCYKFFHYWRFQMPLLGNFQYGCIQVNKRQLDAVDRPGASLVAIGDMLISYGGWGKS